MHCTTCSPRPSSMFIRCMQVLSYLAGSWVLASDGGHSLLQSMFLQSIRSEHIRLRCVQLSRHQQLLQVV